MRNEKSNGTEQGERLIEFNQFAEFAFGGVASGLRFFIAPDRKFKKALSVVAAARHGCRHAFLRIQAPVGQYLCAAWVLVNSIKDIDRFAVSEEKVLEDPHRHLT